MTPLKKTKEMSRWDKIREESVKHLEAQRCASCGAYPGTFHSDDCSIWQKPKPKRSPARQRLYEIAKVNEKLIKEGKLHILSPQRIQQVAESSDRVYRIKLVLWDLVIESRVDRKAPIDVTPYIERIRQIFDKK